MAPLKSVQKEAEWENVGHEGACERTAEVQYLVHVDFGDDAVARQSCNQHMQS